MTLAPTSIVNRTTLQFDAGNGGTISKKIYVFEDAEKQTSIAESAHVTAWTNLRHQEPRSRLSRMTSTTMGPVFTTIKPVVKRASLAFYHALRKDLVPLTLGATGAQFLQAVTGTGGWSKPIMNSLLWMASSLYNYNYDTQQRMARRDLIIGGGWLEKDFVEVLVDGRNSQNGGRRRAPRVSQDVENQILQGYDRRQPGRSLNFVLTQLTRWVRGQENENTPLLEKLRSGERMDAWIELPLDGRPVWGENTKLSEANLIGELPENAVPVNDVLPTAKSVSSLTTFIAFSGEQDKAEKIFHRVLFLGRRSEKEFVLQTGTVPQPMFTVVAGDVLFVRESRLMGVDARVLFESLENLGLPPRPNLKTNEAAVTGEVEPIEKYEAFDRTKNSVKEAPTVLLDKSSVAECRIPVNVGENGDEEEDPVFLKTMVVAAGENTYAAAAAAADGEARPKREWVKAMDDFRDNTIFLIEVIGGIMGLGNATWTWSADGMSLTPSLGGFLGKGANVATGLGAVFAQVPKILNTVVDYVRNNVEQELIKEQIEVKSALDLNTVGIVTPFYEESNCGNSVCGSKDLSVCGGVLVVEGQVYSGDPVCAGAGGGGSSIFRTASMWWCWCWWWRVKYIQHKQYVVVLVTIFFTSSWFSSQEILPQ